MVPNCTTSKLMIDPLVQFHVPRPSLHMETLYNVQHKNFMHPLAASFSNFKSPFQSHQHRTVRFTIKNSKHWWGWYISWSCFWTQERSTGFDSNYRKWAGLSEILLCMHGRDVVYRGVCGVPLSHPESSLWRLLHRQQRKRTRVCTEESCTLWVQV